MKHIFRLFFLLFFVAACTNKSTIDVTKYDVIDSIPTDRPLLEEKYCLDTTSYKFVIDVTFDNDDVKYSRLPEGVTAVIDDTDVKFVSKLGGVEFRISGCSDDASFSLVSDSSVLITLSDVALLSHGGSPIHVNCHQTVFVRCVGHGVNYLVDTPSVTGTDTLKMAAPVYVSGDMVLCGKGKLALCGKRRNAIYCTGRIFVNDVVLAVENSVHDAVFAVGGITIVKGNIRINAVKDAIKSKSGDVLFLDGNILLATTGRKGDGVQAESVYMYGGNVSIKTVGEASRGLNAKNSIYVLDGSLSILTDGDPIFSPKKNDYTSNACIKCNGGMYVGGGYINIENHGTAGKGINCNGKMQMDGGILLVRIYGDDIVHSTIRNAYASAKGIKCDSVISVNGGKIETLVFGKGERCEGIESKGRFVIGGDANIYVYATDDAINAGDDFIMNGGKLYAYSVANDAIDGNAAVIINDGLIIANGSNSPEQGIDCDFDSNFRIVSGTLVSIGGMMGPKPNIPRNKLTTEFSVVWSEVELQRDRFVNLCNDDGEILLAYKLPRSIKKGSVVFSLPQLKRDGLYSLFMSDTIANDAVYLGNGLYRGGLCVKSEKKNEFRILSLVTRIDADGNVETLTSDTVESKQQMMPPPLPPHEFHGDVNGMKPPHIGRNAEFRKQGQNIPPPPFNLEEIPDSLKREFSVSGDKSLFQKFFSFANFKRNDEGYNVNNLPGGGW